MNKSVKKVILLLLCSLLMIVPLFGCSVVNEIMTTNDFADSVQEGDVQSTDEECQDDVVSEEDAQSGEEAEEAEEPEEESEQSTSSESVIYTFRNDKLLDQHFEKHGSEFDYATVDEYVQGANKVINDERTLHKIEAEDGDDVYYLEETNEFVIVSTDGYLRTYFKPSAGRKYFDRQ